MASIEPDGVRGPWRALASSRTPRVLPPRGGRMWDATSEDLQQQRAAPAPTAQGRDHAGV
jgi:hypothetical protein